MASSVLCQCGCGGLAPIAKMTARRFGHVKGQPCRFIFGHSGRRGSPAVRFAARTRRAGPDECWAWDGYHLKNGYGRFGLRRGTILLAHRFAYELANGPIPKGLFVMHSCDNPGCVNPAHLRAGTHLENMADMRAKGRGRGKHSTPRSAA